MNEIPTETLVYAILHTTVNYDDLSTCSTVSCVFFDENEAQKEVERLNNASFRDESIHYFRIVPTYLVNANRNGIES